MADSAGTTPRTEQQTHDPSLHLGRRLPILMYHSISARPPAGLAPYALHPAEFEEHIARIRDDGHRPMTMRDVVEACDRGSELPPSTVVITFDDGFADFLDDALPILDRYRCTATLYVTSGFVGSTSQWLYGVGAGDLPLLDWTDLDAVAAAGVEVGAHGHEHLQMDVLTPAALAREVVTSRGVLEQRLTAPVTSFAYPYGYCNRRVRRAVREAGFTNACAVGHLANPPEALRFRLTRTAMVPGMSAQRVGDVLEGRDRTVDRLTEIPKQALWRLARRHAGRQPQWRDTSC